MEEIDPKGVSIHILSSMVTHNGKFLNSIRLETEFSGYESEDDDNGYESEDDDNGYESEDDDSQPTLFGLTKKVVGLVAIPVITGIMVSSFFDSIIIRGRHNKLTKEYETLSNNHNLLLQENKLLVQKNKSISEDKN